MNVQPQPTVDLKTRAAVRLMSPMELAVWWPRIEQMLQMTPHTWEGMTIEQFEEDAKNGNIQVWGSGTYEKIELVYFTHLVQMPAAKVLRAIWCCGEGIEKMASAINASLEQFAMEHQCTDIDVVGREGWKKILSPLGYEKRAVRFTRPIKQKRMQ